MLLLQLSAGQGPEECCLAVIKALQKLQQEADVLKVKVNVIEQEQGYYANTLCSVLVSIDGEKEALLAEAWTGTLQWVCQSPYRTNHGRKNWFIGGNQFASPVISFEHEIRFETCRSSGAGGQHVNKTDSAVRAVHVSTGISVKVQAERSQHANKRLALLLIAQKLEMQKQSIQTQQKEQRRMHHRCIERGNPKRIFYGVKFVE